METYLCETILGLVHHLLRLLFWIGLIVTFAVLLIKIIKRKPLKNIVKVCVIFICYTTFLVLLWFAAPFVLKQLDRWEIRVDLKCSDTIINGNITTY